MLPKKLQCVKTPVVQAKHQLYHQITIPIFITLALVRLSHFFTTLTFKHTYIVSKVSHVLHIIAIHKNCGDSFTGFNHICEIYG